MHHEQNLSIDSVSLRLIEIGDRTVPIEYVRNRRARRYVIRVTPDGRVRATIPPFGSKGEAYAFAERERHWIERQLKKRIARPISASWIAGTSFLFRGEFVTLEIEPLSKTICFADQRIDAVTDPSMDLRPLVERHLFRLASRELIPRTVELAQLHGLRVRRVAIRSQRTRWGSCSPTGTVSLNWRLVQMPALVSDYIILHELMHLREMNHSKAFWRCVEKVCPNHQIAERWIKEHADQMKA
jgi:predicted metal-dependent hydrolase